MEKDLEASNNHQADTPDDRRRFAGASWITESGPDPEFVLVATWENLLHTAGFTTIETYAGFTTTPISHDFSRRAVFVASGNT